MPSDQNSNGLSEGDDDQYPYISRIRLQNFMCHENFEIQLGRRLNLIYGTNGSGKSTILTAIMVALGSNARTTSRSKSLGELVMTGKTKAWIHVTFHIPTGYGELTRRFGHEVTVTRIIGSRGDLKYEITDAAGEKVQKAGAKDVKFICYHFGVYPDNELAMLSQENAKEFLVNATGKVKYTKLQRALFQHIIAQNKHAVKISQDDQEQSLRIMRNREQAIELAELSSQEVLTRATEQIRRKRLLSTIGNILAWRKYDVAVDSCSNLRTELAEKYSAYQRMESAGHFEVEQRRCVTELAALNDEARLARDEYDRLSNELGEYEKEETERRFFVARSAEDMAANNEKIDRLRREVANLEEKAADHSPGKLAQRRKSLEEKRASSETRRNEALNVRTEFEEKVDALRSQQKELSSTIKDLQFEENSIQKSIQDANAELGQLNSGQVSYSHRRNPLHQKHERLQHLITKKTGWHQVPQGPLYKFLEMRDDGADYSPALERLWNQVLDCWWVQTDSDRLMLKQLASSIGLNNIRIILRKDDAFEFGSSLPRPSSHYKRALDLISVESDAIKRILVDLNRVESMVMVSGTRKAFEVLRMDANVRNVLALSTTSRGKTQFMQVSANAARTDSATVSASDIVRIRVGTKARRDQIRSRVNDYETQAENIRQRIRNEKQKQDQLTADLKQCERHIMKANNVMRRSEDEIADLSQEIMSIDTDVGATDYADDIARLMSEIQRTEGDVAEGAAALAAFEGDLAAVQASVEEHQRLKRLSGEKISHIDARVRDIERKHSQVTQELNRRDSSLSRLRTAIQDQEASLRSLDSLVQDLREDAESTHGSRKLPAEDGPDAESNGLFVMTDAELEDERRTLLNRQEVLAASEEEIRKAEEEARSAANARAEIAQKRREMQDLSTSIERRHKLRVLNEERAWNNMKKLIEITFSDILNHRKFTGKLTIDDVKQSLTVEARPEGNANQRVSTLSGGEKSFTQVALLMAVWSAMQVSLVAMDEYDVFMDKVNRSMSLHLLGKTVSDYKMQCILITPQDVDTSVLTGMEFKMHKLKPARGR